MLINKYSAIDDLDDNDCNGLHKSTRDYKKKYL
jgi:hypothetical protein